jgi:GNAT superfamily N-acetyltransferase
MVIRPAEPADAMAVARVHVRTWQTAYRTLIPDSYLDSVRPEERAERYDFATRDPLKPHTVVAADGDAILGFATTAPSRDPDLPEHGELCALYVDPAQWGRGIGVALISAARARLGELGFRKALLWVLAGNVRAVRFYEIDGWRRMACGGCMRGMGWRSRRCGISEGWRDRERKAPLPRGRGSVRASRLSKRAHN